MSLGVTAQKRNAVSGNKAQRSNATVRVEAVLLSGKASISMRYKPRGITFTRQASGRYAATISEAYRKSLFVPGFTFEVKAGCGCGGGRGSKLKII